MMKRFSLLLFLVVMLFSGIGPTICIADFICDGASKRYHDDQCPEVEKIKKRHKRSFRSEAQAESRGFYPCQICIPPDSKDMKVKNAKRALSLPIDRSKEYIGDANAKICHQSWCELTDKIKPSKRVSFNDVDRAWQRGYKPCKECSPPVKPKSNASAPIKEKKEVDSDDDFIAPEMEGDE